MLKRRTSELRWRGAKEFGARRCAAWTFSWTLCFFFYFYTLIVALKFGEEAMNKMVTYWLVAYGWTFALIEPVQILIIAGAPCFIKEDSRCGQCMMKCFFVYNEIFAP